MKIELHRESHLTTQFNFPSIDEGVELFALTHDGKRIFEASLGRGIPQGYSSVKLYNDQHEPLLNQAGQKISFLIKNENTKHLETLSENSQKAALDMGDDDKLVHPPMRDMTDHVVERMMPRTVR